MFDKAKFEFHGGYLTYEGKFVARFKHTKSGKGSFQSFLIKNFTPEEYFAKLESGVSPLRILEDKGYLLPQIKKLLKERGYEISPAGFKKYINDGIAARGW